MPTLQEKNPPRHGGGKTNGVRRKRRYERTTPIGRARKNLAKIDKTLALVRSRLESWGGITYDSGSKEGVNDILDEALSYAVDAGKMVGSAISALGRLEKSGFVPARRSSVVTFESDDQVKISDKYKTKYLEVYPASVLDGLVVSKVLPTGEIAVKHAKTAFIVPKSHLGRRA